MAVAKAMAGKRDPLSAVALTSGVIGSAGAEAIAGACRGVSSIDLSGNRLRNLGATRFAAVLKSQFLNGSARQLTELKLAGNNISSAGAVSIAEIVTLSALKVLK